MRVGVVLPVRTPLPYLGEALDAILGQEPAPAQVVVVDDASPDPLRLEPRHEGRCELLRLDASRGPAGARQAGLETLSTGLVALCDDDDAWEPGRLAAGLEALERHPDAAVCFGRAIIVGEAGLPTGERWAEPAAGVHAAASFGPVLYERNPIPNSSALLRRTPLEQVGGFADSLTHGEDWDLWLRLVAAGEAFVFQPAAGVRYRRHGGGLTADMTALATGAMEVHERHAQLVDEGAYRRTRAADFTALARGRVRERDYPCARAALAEAAELEAPGPRERLLRGLLAVPGARGALGRRSPYPR
ncbi:MAG: glycosyltransferase family 2 protein [Solirubrobacteraceae bacterium]